MPDETASQIDHVAADWAARLDRGTLSPEEDQALDVWLAADPRRAGAFARARAIALYSERARALGPTFDPAQFKAQPKSLSRRQLLWSGTATAAGLAVALSTGFAITSRGEAYTTLRGQMKVIPLSDGSVVSLNTASRIKVEYTKKQRIIHLEDGEALFDVAHDKARPFIVLAGQTDVVAIGTSFSVRRLAGTPVEVLVREGVVEIKPHTRDQASMPLASMRLGANMRAIAAPQGTQQVEPVSMVSMAPPEVERAMAWREGRIAFEGQTLQEAVSEFRRYSDTRIVIDDPAIAGEPITGLFQVNDPVGFAQTVALSFDLKAEVSDKQVRLFR